MPTGPIPAAAAVDTFDAVVAHGLVWVRLDCSVATTVPACPALDDLAMKVLVGDPYTWAVSAARRVGNFVDLSHFAWGARRHAGAPRRTGAAPAHPHRVAGELRFTYDPPALPDDPQPTAMLGSSAYRMPIPCTVDIEFWVGGGHRRRLWMTASPVDRVTSRCFWLVERTDDLAGDDRQHLAFQAHVLREDEPVVTNQVPAELPLDTGAELSVRTDRISIAYRRWLRALAVAALEGPAAYAEALGLDQAPQVLAG